MEKRKRLISLVLALAMVCSLGGALFVPASAASLPFTDIGNSPYYDSIEYVYNEGIMNGITTTTFEPETTVTRAMFVTTLYRMAGQPVQNGTTDFVDVEEGRYYYNAVVWANANNIVNGMTVTTFEPDRIVTIQQALTILHRFADYQEILPGDLVDTLAEDSMGANYDLYVHTYAADAVNWAMNCGILSSKITTIEPDKYTVGTVNSAALVSRGLCAYYLHRYMALVYCDMKVFETDDSEYRSITGQLQALCNNYATYGASELKLTEAVHARYAFYLGTTVYLAANGNGSRLYIGESNADWITVNDIERGCAADSELIYLSGNYTGGELASKLVSPGEAKNVVGFVSSIIYDVGHERGPNYFDVRFMAYLNNGYTIQDAIDYSIDDMESNGIEFNGIGSIRVYS